MRIVWEDLGKGMNNPKQKSLWIGPLCAEYYREALKFLSEYYPNREWDIYNLPFLDKPVEDLSKDEIVRWRFNIGGMRHYLDKIIEDS